MPPRSKRQKQEAQRKWAAAALIFFCLGLTGVALWALLASRASHPRIDAQGCPVEGPRAIYAVAIDSTDLIGAVTRDDIRNGIRDFARRVPQFGELRLYIAGATETAMLKPVFRRCNPGDPSKVTWVSDNPEFAAKAYAGNYLKPLDTALDRLLDFQEANASPILEGVQAVTVSAFPPEHAKLPRSLMVVSDLLQNSPRYSVYRGFDAETAARAADSLHASLDGVDVELLIVPRREAFQREVAFLNFWTVWFTQSGATVQSVTRLQGVN